MSSDQPEEPPQRQGEEEISCLPRHEKIRLVVLGLALLLLLAGFLLYLLFRTIFPLFGVVTVTFLGYWGMDAWLATSERPRR
jgi:hypothetical protein